MWGADTDKMLSLLRTFRDETVARNDVVRKYVSLLYQNSSEIVGLLNKYPSLCVETRKLIEVLIPSIKSFFNTRKLTLTTVQILKIESFLNQFELKVGPELKGIIQSLKKDLKNGTLFLIVS